MILLPCTSAYVFTWNMIY
uniref:Uncharacterized protein n=1 Tax=Arundo donax TaxID=35708 RepID=A0A0A9CCG7_ARUDO